MGLIQTFIEAEAKRSIHQYRERFAEWLSSVDIDGDGVNDRQQILADFDRIRDGIWKLSADSLTCSSSLIYTSKSTVMRLR